MGMRLPSIHDGRLVAQGVRCMALRRGDTELITGGSDGAVMVWDITGSEGVGRLIKSIQVKGMEEGREADWRDWRRRWKA